MLFLRWVTEPPGQCLQLFRNRPFVAFFSRHSSRWLAPRRLKSGAPGASVSSHDGSFRIWNHPFFLGLPAFLLRVDDFWPSIAIWKYKKKEEGIGRQFDCSTCSLWKHGFCWSLIACLMNKAYSEILYMLCLLSCRHRSILGGVGLFVLGWGNYMYIIKYYFPYLPILRSCV